MEDPQPEINPNSPLYEKQNAGFPTPPPPETVPKPKETRPYIPIKESELSVETPEWKKSDEWREYQNTFDEINRTEFELDKLEKNLEKAIKLKEASKGDKELAMEEIQRLKQKLADLKIKVGDQRVDVVRKIEEALPTNLDQNSTDEQRRDYRKMINDQCFDAFIKGEIDSARKFKKENREKSLTDKAKEFFGKALNYRVVQGYLKMNKWKRLAVTTTLFAAGGYAIGAAAVGGSLVSAAAYTGQRFARGGASLAFGGAARVAAEKKWDEKKIEEEFKKREEEIKNSDEFHYGEKKEEFRKLREWEEKEKRKFNRNKKLVTFGVGAGAGLLAGLSEGIAFSKEGSLIDQVRGSKGASPVLEQPQIPQTPPAVPPTLPRVPTEAPQTPIVPKLGHIEPVRSPIPDKLENTEVKISQDTSVLVHEVKAGDSTWNILKEILNHDDDFTEMSEAQKTFVLSTLTNKALEDPENYGLGEDGALNIGSKTDFTELFKDSKEITSIFEKAENIKVGSTQEKLIIDNNKAITDWVNNKENANIPLTNDKVAEILAHKPKSEAVSLEEDEETLERMYEPEGKIVPKDIVEVDKDIEERMWEPEQKKDLNALTTTSGIGAVGAMTAIGNLNEKNKLGAELKQEIEEARKRLEVLEGGKNIQQNGIRTMYGDTEKFKQENVNNQKIEEAFRGGIHSIFGKDGFMGIGKIEGVNSKEWKEINGYLAKELVQYTKGELERTKLSPKFIKVLDSSKGQKFIQDLVFLKNQTGDVEPYENEHPDSYMKRLIAVVMRKEEKEKSEGGVIQGGNVIEMKPKMMNTEKMENIDEIEKILGKVA